MNKIFAILVALILATTTVAAVAPVINDPTDNGYISGTYQITWTGDENPWTVEYNDGSWNNICASTSNTFCNWDTTLLPDAAYTVRVTDTNTNQQTITVNVDNTQSTVLSAVGSPDPAKAGTVTVTITFDENMDTSVTPTVQITGLTTDPYAVTETSYVDDTWIGTFTLLDEDEAATATIAVTGVDDLAGNTMADDLTAGNFEVDTIDPTIVITDDAVGAWGLTDDIVATVQDADSGLATSDYVFVTAPADCDDTAAWPGTNYVSTATITINTDNNDYLCFRAVDNAGNDLYAVTGQLMVDVTNPTLTFTDDIESGWVTNDDVTVDSDFDLAGKDTFDWVIVADAAVCDATSAWPGTNINDLDTLSFADQTQNGNDVCFRLIDNSGNTIYQRTSNMIQVDITNPAVTITDDAVGAWGTSDTIVATNADADSGPATMEYVIVSDGLCDSSDFPGTAYTSGANLDITTDNNDYVCFVGYDNVGNADYAVTAQLMVDATAPIVDAGTDASSNVLYTQDATVDASISGVQTYAWTQTSGPGTITFGTAAAEDTTVTADTDGVYVVRLTVTDNAGNVAFDEFTLNWDTTSPNTYGVNLNKYDIYDNESLQVTALVQDASPITVKTVLGGSDFDMVQQGNIWTVSIPLNTLGLSNGTTDLYVVALDNAGNQESQDDDNTATFTLRDSQDESYINMGATISIIEDYFKGLRNVVGNIYATIAWVNTQLANYYTSAQLDAGQLDNRYYTEAEVDAAIDADVLVETNARIADVDAEEARATAAENTLQNNIDAEALARTNADTTLQNNIDAEALARTNADTTLQNNIDKIGGNIETASGVKVNLVKGWTEFRLPAHVIMGTAYTSKLNLVDYNVTTVLNSIDGNYDYLSYYDGSNWRVYVPNNVTTDFVVFPTAANTPDHVYHIHMTTTDVLEIATI